MNHPSPIAPSPIDTYSPPVPHGSSSIPGQIDPDTIEVVPWLDPLVDVHGYPVDDPYVEMFWLPVLGPTASWLLRRFVGGLIAEPEGYTTNLVHLARSIGVAHSSGRHSPFARALHRCTMFGVAQQVAISPMPVYAVRRTVPRVARRHLERLPASLRSLHDTWPPSRIDTAHRADL